MAARNDTFPWASHYGHYDFFEDQMAKHRVVVSLVSKTRGVYELTRQRGDSLRVFVCECYAFGVAEYLETLSNIGKTDVIVINSAWCGYTHDAKRYCREAGVGLFKIGEFMSALHKKDYWLYLTEDEEEYFDQRGWL